MHVCVLTHFCLQYYNTFKETTEHVGVKINIHKDNDNKFWTTHNAPGPNDVLFTFVRLSIQTPTGKWEGSVSKRCLSSVDNHNNNVPYVTQIMQCLLKLQIVNLK